MSKTLKVWLAVAALLFAGIIIAATRYIDVPGPRAGGDSRAGDAWRAWVNNNTSPNSLQRALLNGDTIIATFADGLKKEYGTVCNGSECGLTGGREIIADSGVGGGEGGNASCSTSTTYTPNWATASGSTCNGDGTSRSFTVRWVESMESHDTMNCT